MSDRKPTKKRGPLGRFDNPVRIIVVGTTNCKTALIVRLVEGEFVDEPSFTIEETYWKKIGDVQMEITDTAPSEQFQALREMYTRQSHVAVAVFRITSRADYDELCSRVEQAQRVSTNHPIPVVMVGSHKDLESERQVTTQEAQEFAAKHNAPYIETSAKTGENVREVFEQAVNLAFEAQNDNVDEEDERKRCTVQ